MIGKFCLTTVIIFSTISLAEETCGRTAIVNNQPILVDISSSSKGEGLRPYLSKDPAAESYLNKYQEKILSPNYSAIIGSAGLGLAIGGSLLPSDGHVGSLDGKDLITLGLSVLAINFLVVQGIEFKHEQLLQKSVDEYNKRNQPKIYFIPYSGQWPDAQTNKTPFGLIAKLQTSF